MRACFHATRLHLDRIDAVRIEGEVLSDLFHGRIGRLVGPHRIDRLLAAGRML